MLIKILGLIAVLLGPGLLFGSAHNRSESDDTHHIYYFGDIPYAFPREVMRGPGGDTRVVDGRNHSTVLWGLAGWDFVPLKHAPPGGPTWSLRTESYNFQGPRATRIQGIWAEDLEDQMMAAVKGPFDRVTQYLDVEASLYRPREEVLMTQEFGLYRFQRSDPEHNPQRYYVIFQDTMEGLPKTFIRCDQGAHWRGYGCSHWFVHNGAVITEAYYNY